MGYTPIKKGLNMLLGNRAGKVPATCMNARGLRVRDQSLAKYWSPKPGHEILPSPPHFAGETREILKPSWDPIYLQFIFKYPPLLNPKT